MCERKDRERTGIEGKKALRQGRDGWREGIG